MRGGYLTALSAVILYLRRRGQSAIPAEDAFLPSEIQRLGESKGMVVPFAILYLVCTALYVIPRTVILGAILLTGYLGGAKRFRHASLAAQPLSSCFQCLLERWCGAVSGSGMRDCEP